MADPITLARPYARAAFEAAQHEHGLAAWSAALGFAAKVAALPAVAALEFDPQLEPAARLALYLPPDSATDSPFHRFLQVLTEEGRLELLPEIHAMFQALQRAAESRLLVRVTSALALEDEQQTALTEALKRRFRREIELAVAIDPALIGGAVIDAGDEVIDGSVRGRLERMSQSLTH